MGFAGLLRRLRAGTKLTQEELAEAAGLSPRSVSDLERGINRTARKDTAVLLAGALGLAEPVRDLFIAAARGRVPAAQVLAAVQRQASGAFPAAAGDVHGFATALTSFIGRGGAVGEVSGLLDQHRLVTVTGPGGSGKTRLASEVARLVAGRFADGVWLAELAAVRDPAQVPAVVAAALGMRDHPGVSPTAALARVLARQQLLLVLDNCEHVISAATELCAELLAACDDVRVLATSREPLAVAWEARYRLTALTLPRLDDPSDVAGSEAVALFTDRARRADAGFALDRESGPTVARLVVRLDGMPLAIELAAARVEALGVAQLLDGLDDRFALLASGDRLAASRQRSLAATVEWSYQLLSEHEQQVFRQLSVFPGPFTLEGARAVGGEGAGPTALRLVDCSLLSPPRTGPDGRSRYVMLETLRAYGAGLLAGAGEADAAAAALAHYALRVAEQTTAGLQTSTAEVAAARRLDAEDANMRRALAWAMDHDAALASQLAVALAPWWFLRGRLAGQYPLLREAAGRMEPGGDSWCAAQFWLGLAAFWSGDQVTALGHLTAIRDAIGNRGPSPALADALGGRSLVLGRLGRTSEAADDGRLALAMAREIGYSAGEALALVFLSFTILHRLDDPDGAVQLARQAQQVTADIPGWIARASGNILTAALIEAGDLAAAERSCAAGLALARDAGDLSALADRLLLRMVTLDLRADRVEDAESHLREALEIAAPISQLALLNCLDCCGYLCAATGRTTEAVTVWAAAVALAQQAGFIDTPADTRRRREPLRKARQALGPDQARMAEERGAAMNLATAAEYAHMLTEAGPQKPTAPDLRKVSAQERKLVTLVARGRTDAQIATQLHISIHTVRTDLDRIRDKTGCRRRADLTRLALQAGLV